MTDDARLTALRALVREAFALGESFARVLVGPFATRAAAASALRHLSADGDRPFIAVE